MTDTTRHTNPTDLAHQHHAARRRPLSDLYSEESLRALHIIEEPTRGPDHAAPARRLHAVLKAKEALAGM